MSIKYADLHCHPSTKSFLSGTTPEDRKSCWDDMGHPIRSIASQSSFKQMIKGDVQLAVAAIIPGERPFFQNTLFGTFAPLFTVLDNQFVKEIMQNEHSYFKLLTEEIAHLEQATSDIREEDRKRKVQIIKHIDEAEEGQLNLILAVEGGHSLGDKDDNNHIDNLISLIRDYKFRFLYLTLTHLTNQGEFYLSNHSYGTYNIKLEDFRPAKVGISDAGIKLIDYCYTQDPPICIDVKHMSLYARKQFYNHYKEKGYTHPIIASHVAVNGRSWEDFTATMIGNPRIENKFVKITHRRPLGISGDNGRWRNKTHFNPWSMNLFKEDILNIIDTGGIIGLILDDRVLGYVSLNYLKKLSKYEAIIGTEKEEEENDRDPGYLRQSQEYFYYDEFKKLLGNNFEDTQVVERSPREETWNSPIELLTNMQEKLAEEAEELNAILEEELAPLPEGMQPIERIHIRHLINNILYIVEVAGVRAWKHICIGSDFDGLINSIEGGRDASQYPRLETLMLQLMPEMLADAAIQKPGQQYFIDKDDMATRIRMIMYHNMENFLEQHFKAESQTGEPDPLIV